MTAAMPVRQCVHCAGTYASHFSEELGERTNDHAPAMEWVQALPEQRRTPLRYRVLTIAVGAVLVWAVLSAVVATLGG